MGGIRIRVNRYLEKVLVRRRAGSCGDLVLLSPAVILPSADNYIHN
ncbi:unnamed protein product [Amoebophrya sp. A25]|nr:unnamed protein product [Amoebophrya sp. A25]|eukprot:GSA25T00023033001.1